MRTLFEILKDKLTVKPEPKDPTPAERIWNPISAVPGKTYLSLDTLDYRGKNWHVESIQEYTVEIGGKSFKFAEYVLKDVGTENPVFFRITPNGDAWQALILDMPYDMEYVEDLDLAVQGKNKVDGEVMEADEPLKLNLPDDTSYWRIEDVTIAYPAEVFTVKEKSSWDGVRYSAERIKFWDYWREAVQDGVKATEYCYVEMKDLTGWFQIKRGFEIDPNQVSVF